MNVSKELEERNWDIKEQESSALVAETTQSVAANFAFRLLNDFVSDNENFKDIELGNEIKNVFCNAFKDGRKDVDGYGAKIVHDVEALLENFANYVKLSVVGYCAGVEMIADSDECWSEYCNDQKGFTSSVFTDIDQ